jgi:hypothetical protein
MSQSKAEVSPKFRCVSIGLWGHPLLAYPWSYGEHKGEAPGMAEAWRAVAEAAEEEHDAAVARAEAAEAALATARAEGAAAERAAVVAWLRGGAEALCCAGCIERGEHVRPVEGA